MSAPALAVLAAAGSGRRLGEGTPKALVRVGGEPMVWRAARGLARSGRVGAIEVCAPPGARERFRELVRAGGGAVEDVPLGVCEGGVTRQASVDRAFAALPALAWRAGIALGPSTVVLIHDAARCLTPASLIARVADAVLAGDGAVVPGLPVADTLKEVGEARGAARPIVGTPNRRAFRRIQTPQGFRWALIARAHRAARDLAGAESSAATDDAALVEALGEPVAVVAGDERAFKVTTPLDLRLARVIAGPGCTAGVAQVNEVDTAAC